jgi:hypothetical protein
MRRWVILGVVGLAVVLGVVAWVELASRPAVSAVVTRGRGQAFSSKDFYRATVVNHEGHRALLACRVVAVAHGVDVASDWFFTPRLNDHQTYVVARGMPAVLTEPGVPTSAVERLKITCGESHLAAYAAE